MTVWDELWAERPVVVYGLRGGKSTHADWLKKIKVEGDRLHKILDDLTEMGVVTVYDDRHWSTDYNILKEKAEKWDFVRPAMAKTMIEQNDKLEAIKNLRQTYWASTKIYRDMLEKNPRFKPNILHKSKMRLIRELDKILEGNG